MEIDFKKVHQKRLYFLKSSSYVNTHVNSVMNYPEISIFSRFFVIFATEISLQQRVAPLRKHPNTTQPGHRFVHVLQQVPAPQLELRNSRFKILLRKISKFSRFFNFFPSIFFKKKKKNYVCFNLTTKTSKYHLDVSQLSDQCFRGFLLGLLSKKSKHIFFEKFFT